MSATIAKEPMGICSCGLPTEAGEYVLLRPGGAVHVGCHERTTATGPTMQTESSGFLFDDPVQAESERVKETVGAARFAIHGETYSGNQDKERLTKHLLAIFELLRDGQYRSITTIAEAVGGLETSCAARCRQLKAIGHAVPKRWVKNEDGRGGYFEYALIVNQSLIGTWEGQDESRAA